MKIFSTSIVGTFILTIAFFGCKKDEENPTCTQEPGKVDLSFTHLVGTESFAFNTDYTDDFGNKYQFFRADWYLRVSGFVDQDSNPQIVSDSYYLKIDPSVTTVNYGEYSPMTLYNLQWAVGVDSVTNHMDPNIHELGSALGNQSPSMHWGWSSGYIFCALDGRVDINGNGNYDPGELFSMHIGMDTTYREGPNLYVNKAIAAGETSVISLDVDYSEFFDGINLAIDNSTHTMDNMHLAQNLANNFEKVLKLH